VSRSTYCYAKCSYTEHP
jgi:hypothetical protein